MILNQDFQIQDFYFFLLNRFRQCWFHSGGTFYRPHSELFRVGWNFLRHGRIDSNGGTGCTESMYDSTEYYNRHCHDYLMITREVATAMEYKVITVMFLI